MKKNRILKVFMLVFAVTLLGSAVAVQASSPKKPVNTKMDVGTQASLAEDLVNALFTDDTHTALVPGVTQATIDTARAVVNLLFPSPLKTTLLNLLNTADNLLLQGQLEAARVVAATAAVNNLFTDGNHNALKVGITLGDINAAQDLVDNLADPAVRAPLNALIDIATNLLDVLNLEVEARAAVDDLFTDSNHIGLKLDITQGDIDSAKSLVDALTNVALKAELNLLLASAQVMIDLRSDEQQARDAVYALFSDGTHTTIKAGLTQAEIDAAKAKVDALPAGDVKTELTLLITSAQSQLNGQTAEQTATAIVDALFTDGTHTAIIAGLTQAAIDNATVIVNNLPAGEVKDDLTALIMTAQNLLNLRNGQAAIIADAQAAVDGLFTDSTHAHIKANLAQADIDAAQVKVDLITFNGQVKATLNALIQDAQEMLDAREAQDAIDDAAKTAVYALFTDDTHTIIKDTTNQALIDAAQGKVNLMQASILKTQLNLLIANAQAQLDLRSPESIAAAIVEALFTDDSHTALIDGITQAVIDNARNIVNALPNSAIKDNLLILVQVAQNLYDQATETPQEQEARTAVNNLFADVNHTMLKDSTNQAAINAAKAKVDALSAGSVKTELTALVVKAQDLLDERNATNAVDNLFTDGTHTVLKPNVTQAMIDAAKALVDALKPSQVKTDLLVLVQRAQDMFNETPAERDARLSVNDLFTDETHTAIKDSTNQAAINVARAKVNALPAGAVKTELTPLVQKAQDLLDERNATNAVNNLFTDDTHTAIKPSTTQVTINAATSLVNALKPGAVKTELLGHLQEAQDLLDERNEAEAIVAVDDLYIDSNHTAIKESTTQIMITAAKAKVDILKPGQVKTDLTVLVIRAQDLYDEREATIIVEGLFIDDTHTTLQPWVFQSVINAARTRVNALKAGEVKTYLLGLLDIAQQLLDDNQPEVGDEYNFWNGKGTYWYRYTASRQWWNWKITTSKYTTLTYFASHRCVSDEPERLNCATLDRRYDFTTDSTGKIIGQLYHKWDVKGLIYSYREFTLNNDLNRLVKTYGRETRYYSNTRTRSIEEQNKRLADDTVITQNRLNYRTNGVQQRYNFFQYSNSGLPQRLDRVVYNSSGEKRTRGNSRAYFYQQSYNASGNRTGTLRWTYNANGNKVNRINYGQIDF